MALKLEAPAGSPWSVVYERAIRDDGSLLFPERLSRERLDAIRRTMGSYLFANQYQNEVIPDDEKRFRTAWLKYFTVIPGNTYRFAFIDPAIGQKDHHDFTSVSLVDVAEDGHWYLRAANRYRLTPTEIVEKVFELNRLGCMAIGIEQVAYQEALLYMLAEKMRDRRVTLPVKGITRTKISKHVRILGLVPRFEWGGISISHGLTDFEDEYNTFPRAKYDDILDGVASLEDIVFYPERETRNERTPAPNDPGYESWYIRQLAEKGAAPDSRAYPVG